MYGIFKIILQFLILALKHQDQQHSNLHFFYFSWRTAFCLSKLLCLQIGWVI